MLENLKTMRKNLERNPILRKQQSQRKRFGSKSLDPKIEFEKKNFEEKYKNAPSEDSSILQDETKTEVQITINGEDVFLIKIQKHSTNFTLADVKNQILHKPKIFGINNVQMYDYTLYKPQLSMEMLVFGRNR